MKESTKLKYRRILATFLSGPELCGGFICKMLFIARRGISLCAHTVIMRTCNSDFGGLALPQSQFSSLFLFVQTLYLCMCVYISLRGCGS